MNTAAAASTLNATPAAATDGTWKASTLNKWTCPAKFGGGWAADAAPDSGNASPVAAYTSLSAIITNKDWWCSDGTFNLTQDTFGTGVTAEIGRAHV